MPTPRLACAYILHDDYWYLAESITSVRRAGPVFCFVSRVPWADEPGDWEQTARIATDAGAEVVLGEWRSELDHRLGAVDALKERGFTHALIPDGDEIVEPALLRALCRAARADQADRLHCHMDTYWKSPEYVIRPRESLTPAMMVRLDRARPVGLSRFEGGRSLVLGPGDGLLHHLSYTGPDARIRRKLATWSHRNEVVEGWYENVWRRWDGDRLMRNLHPTHPAAYGFAERISVPRLLKRAAARFRKLAPSEAAGCSPPRVPAGWPLVSVVIPLHGGAEDLRHCLDSLAKCTDLIHETIVVDNASPDDAADAANAYAASGGAPPIRVIRMGRNAGFAAACNRGLAESNGDTVLFLNSDTVAPRAGLVRLVEALLSARDVAATGPLTNFAVGQNVAPNITSLDTLELFAQDLAGRACDDVETDMLSGFCIAARRSVLGAIGGFDERFGLGTFEDNDLSYRMRRAGHRLLIATRAYVHHHGGRTLRRIGADPRGGVAGLMHRNEAIFRQKWHGDLESGFASHLSGLAPGRIVFNPARSAPGDWVSSTRTRLAGAQGAMYSRRWIVGTGEPIMYLDELTITNREVGWGALGLHGDLGYEGGSVLVQGQPYTHSISAHPPSRVVFATGHGFERFACEVALNDDIATSSASADFSILADGVVVAATEAVRAGELPRPLEADIRGAEQLELCVTARRWEHCHAVWLDPVVAGEGATTERPRYVDCLERVEILPPARPITGERCVATVVSPGYAGMLADMLGSLQANGRCEDAIVVVFAVDADEECRAVAARFGARLVECRAVAPIRSMVKSVLYSAAGVVGAEQFVCLDADTLVFGDLRPLFAALEVCPPGSVLVASDQYIAAGARTLGEALWGFYRGRAEDLAYLLGAPRDEANFPLVINDGVFAAGRQALVRVDQFMRRLLPRSTRWMEADPTHGARNQFVFNLALARLGCAVQIDDTYNLLPAQNRMDRVTVGGRERLVCRGRPVRVVHFAGPSRPYQAPLRTECDRLAVDGAVSEDGDHYAQFTGALRLWIGMHGTNALAWSFYGTHDGSDGIVRDTATFPLLAALHYLMRANGCIRVFEAGTGRGISTACLAAAVAHHPDGRVVTVDREALPDRHGLWSLLPDSIASCIETRMGDSLGALEAAVAAGETYEAALLDSAHDAAHVWAEFERAARLVCPGGLILIHDAVNPSNTVGEALRWIEGAGYGVTRLWTAEGGVPADDHLGLAVIENRAARPAPAPSAQS